MPTLLVVDDEPGIVQSLEKIFSGEGIHVISARSGEEALGSLQQQPVDVVLTDLRMARLSGLDLLRTIRNEFPEVEVILMTAYATVESAVEAMREGAYDFVTKPFRKIVISKVVKRALETRALIAENQRLKNELLAHQEGTSILGMAPNFRRALEVIDQVAPTDATVLLLGESGTGKELFARRLHERSLRHKLQFVAVNCAALPDALIESELFGYEKGAFTGAQQTRIGSFARANKGTLFLDEIGELPFLVQAKLLRALQDGEIQPLGGGTQHVDVRLIAATHRDLNSDVKAGRFREDLFYRLNVVQVRLPPLRERPEDIRLLAEAFLQNSAKRANKVNLHFSGTAIDVLMGYAFPGNVRELQNAIEHAVLLSRTNTIEVNDLPEAITLHVAHVGVQKKQGAFIFPFGTALEDMERLAIRETLERTHGDKELAARLLGISLRTIYRKLGEAEP